MKTTLMAMFFVLASTHLVSHAQPATTATLSPVPVSSGTIGLLPSNSQVNFIGTHEGPKPDPRKGGFAKFVGSVELDQTGAVKSVGFDIEAGSLFTEIPKLTAHLKSPDFFDVRQHPKATFRSNSIVAANKPGVYEITGTFALLGNARDIKIPAEISVTDRGITLVSSFIFDRTKFGMTYGEGKVKKNVEISVIVGMPTKAPGK
jgi:polyisoprenoid-binding protein YceI